MRRSLLGALLLAGLIAGSVLTATQRVQASKQFLDYTDVKCEQCHSKKVEADRGYDDLTACGKAALKYMEAKGYKSKSIKKGDVAAEKRAAKLVKGFSCP